jgi:enamine deaminase RidA (YjgF/YER057c/UK114 family)
MAYDELAPDLPYDHASIVPAGALLITAGACPLDRDGSVVAAGDHEAQAHRAVDNLLAVLDEHGAGAEHLVRTTIYVVGDRSDLVRTWTVVAGRLAPYRPPSSLIGVSVLGYADQLVEIDGVAALPR